MKDTHPTTLGIASLLIGLACACSAWGDERVSVAIAGETPRSGPYTGSLELTPGQRTVTLHMVDASGRVLDLSGVLSLEQDPDGWEYLGELNGYEVGFRYSMVGAVQGAFRPTGTEAPFPFSGLHGGDARVAAAADPAQAETLPGSVQVEAAWDRLVQQATDVEPGQALVARVRLVPAEASPGALIPATGLLQSGAEGVIHLQVAETGPQLVVRLFVDGGQPVEVAAFHSSTRNALLTPEPVACWSNQTRDGRVVSPRPEPTDLVFDVSPQRLQRLVDRASDPSQFLSSRIGVTASLLGAERKVGELSFLSGALPARPLALNPSEANAASEGWSSTVTGTLEADSGGLSLHSDTGSTYRVDAERVAVTELLRAFAGEQVTLEGAASRRDGQRRLDVSAILDPVERQVELIARSDGSRALVEQVETTYRGYNKRRGTTYTYTRSELRERSVELRAFGPTAGLIDAASDRRLQVVGWWFQQPAYSARRAVYVTAVSGTLNADFWPKTSARSSESVIPAWTSHMLRSSAEPGQVDLLLGGRVFATVPVGQVDVGRLLWDHAPRAGLTGTLGALATESTNAEVFLRAMEPELPRWLRAKGPVDQDRALLSVQRMIEDPAFAHVRRQAILDLAP